MLKINLLPENKRRAEATPIARMVTILAGLVVGLALVVLLIFQLLVLRPGLNSDLDAAIKKGTDLKKFAEQADAKKKDIEAMESRKKAIDDLLASRKILWYDIMDKVVDVVERNPLSWLEELTAEYKEAKLGGVAGKAQTEYELKGKFAVAGAEKIPAYQFRESVQSTLVNTGIMPGWEEKLNIITKEMKEYEQGWQTNGDFYCWRERPAAAAPKPAAPKPAAPK